jgi:uncharacterized glyoxalase superfamily protein PhnB
MKLIPVFKVSSMQAAIRHYTEVLDFSVCDPGDLVDAQVVHIANGDALLQLTIFETDRLFGSVVNMMVEDVDVCFTKYLARGLDTRQRPDSPVHQAPTNQTWGTREFYVTDTDGNTIRFCSSTPEL